MNFLHLSTWDSVLFYLCAAVTVSQIVLLFRARRESIIFGKPANRKAVLILLLVLVAAVAFVALRSEDFSQRWPVLAMLGVCCLTFAVSGTSLSPKGMFFSGRFIPFAKAAYYQIEQRKGQPPLLRLSHIAREGIMELKPEQIPEVTALLDDVGVPTFAAYNEKLDRRIDARQNAIRKQKKKK